MEKTKVTIYTDGACSGNPGPGGYGAIIMLDDNKKEIFGAEKDTTNNRMELRAAIEGLKALKRPCTVTLYSDSAYLVNAYNSNWVEGWKKKNWKNSSGEQVKNIDLWQELEALRQIHTVTFVKVKGHADNEFNNRCDELAVNAITKLKNGELKQETAEEKQGNVSNYIQRVFGSLPTFETERLKIRLFKEEDIHDLYEYCSDEQVTKYLPFETYKDISEAKDRINFCIEGYKKLDKPIVWAIEYKQDSKLIGSIDFVRYSEEHKEAEVGYVLNRKYWNKGIMTEALKAIIQFGFEKMELNRIVLRCDERNPASARVMEKNGLKYEGTFREKEYIKGEFVSLKYYSILKREYDS